MRLSLEDSSIQMTGIVSNRQGHEEDLHPLPSVHEVVLGVRSLCGVATVSMSEPDLRTDEARFASENHI